MPLTEEEKKRLDYVNSKGGNIVKEGQKNAFQSGKLTSSWTSGSQSASDYRRMQNNIYEDRRNTANEQKSARKKSSSAYQDASKKQQSLSDKVQQKQQAKQVANSDLLDYQNAQTHPKQQQKTYLEQRNEVQKDPDKKNALSYLEQQTTGQKTTQQVQELQKQAAQRQADEQLKAAENAQKDNETFLSDYEEISGMTPQEIQELEAYTTVRDQGRSENIFDELIRKPAQKKKAAGSLLEKYGQKRLDELAETYGRERHQQQEQEVQQKAQEDVSSTGGAVTRSLGTIALAPLQGAMSVKGRLDELANSTGRYNTLESFVPMDAARVYNNTVKSTVAQNIAGDGSEPLRKWAATFYQAGLGTATSLANAIVLGPGIGTAVNATNQFTQTIADASAQGATPEQAYLYATANAAVDAITDKFPLDRLANAAMAGNTNVILNALKQAGVEATTEGASFIGSYLAEAAILKESSQYAQSVEAYMEQAISQGMQEPQAQAWAQQQADKDIMEQAKQQLLVAGISGAASGGIAAAKGNATKKKLEREEKAAQAIQAEAERQQLEKTGGQLSMDQVQPQQNALTPEQVQRQDQAITDTIDQVRGGQMSMEQLPDQSLQNPQQLEAQPQEVQQPQTVTDIVEQMVRENQAQKVTPEQIQDIVQEAVKPGSTQQEAPEAQPQTVSTQDIADSPSTRDWSQLQPGEDPNAILDQMGPKSSGVENPLADRDWSEVGKRNVKAYMYENPEVKPFYQEEALAMLSELASSTRGERFYNRDTEEYTGVSRYTSDSIANLLDSDGMTYDQIEKGLKAIVNDQGSENNAASKRIEFEINRRLMEGYKNFYDPSQKVPANEDYLNLLRGQQSTQAAVSPEQAIQDTVQEMVAQRNGQRAGQTVQNVAQNMAASAQQPVSDFKNAKTGESITLEGFHGEGKAKGEIYAHAQVPVAGEGRYFAPTENGAKNYGSNVSKETVHFDRPFVVRDDSDWSELVHAAGLRYSSPAYLPEAEAKQYTQSIRDYLTGNGYDGLIVNYESAKQGDRNTATGGWARTIDNVFGGDQYVKYDTQTEQPASPQQLTPEQLVQNAAEETVRTARGETVEPVASVGNSGATPPTDTLGMQNTPSGDIEKSRSVTNSGLNSPDPDIRAGYKQTLQQDSKAGDYQVKHNVDTFSTAQQRTSTPEKVRAEYDYLMNKQDSWTAEDAATGRLVAKELFKSGDVDGVTAMNKQLARVATNAGQVSQAFAISGTMRDASDPQSATESATARIMAMKQENSTYKPGKNGQTFEQWQNSVAQEYTRLGMAVENIPDGDTDAMRDVIRQIAKSRKTTAWFGTSDKLTVNAERILKKLDFDTLKKIADTQIASMPDDFRKRTKTEITAGLRKQSMLTSLKTFERNLVGNAATGFLDSASDSFAGRFADSLLSKVTGKRTVGNDLARSKDYMNAAKDAMDFASLCVELNVPIETDANASFDSATAANKSGKYIGKTFRSNGNFMMRLLYGYQKYMSYALEVSDKIFEGGTNSAVTESLKRLKDSGLSDVEIQQLAEYTANRRTFKDATWEENGKVHGSNLSRVAQNFKNIGKGTDIEPIASAATDVVMPFASVPMNVKQTGIDYKAGIAKGAAEIASIIKDARDGKEINVARQRQAVSDFARGTTGLALTSIMTVAASKGIIQVHNDSDKNKKALEQSEGLSGAQFNWSAFARSSDGGSEKWQSGDIVSSLDFLEPFNDQMYFADELAKDDAVREFLDDPSLQTAMDNFPEISRAFAKGSLLSTASSFLDSPMMDGLTQLSDLISNVYSAAESRSADDMKNAFSEYAGTAASSFVPQFVRQAAQTRDGYYRDTRGENSAEYAKNSILNALPGASETLPKKVNGFGEEQKRGGFVSNFLDPTNTQKLQLNEVSDDLEELSQSPDVSNIYPERQAPLTVKDATGEEVRLTGEQRETYQKEYGDKTSRYYKGLMDSRDFKSLPDELKGDALQKAKEYAKDSARAAVTDYKGTKRGNTRTVVDEIVGEVVKSKASSTMTDLETAWENGADTKAAEEEMKSLYSTYGKQSESIQQAIMDAAEGTTKKYLEGRQSGLSSQKTLSALKSVQAVPKENRGKIGYQLQAIADTKGLSEEDMDIAMKLYMPDYDPSAKSPDVSELRYEYIRKDMGYSAKDYAAFRYAYNVADSEYGNDNDSVSKKEFYAAMENQGYSQKEANDIYTILWGTSNQSKAIKKHIRDLYG